MADSTRTIDVLLKEVPDPALRARLVEAVNALRKRTRFGLVFEGHHPEVSRLPDVPIRRGSLVARRSEKGNVLYRVESITGKKAVCLPEELPPGARDDLFAHSLTLPLAELVTARRFGDPIYPSLKLVDCVQRGGDKPWHILIQADKASMIASFLTTSCREAGLRLGADASRDTSRDKVSRAVESRDYPSGQKSGHCVRIGPKTQNHAHTRRTQNQQ